MKSLHFKIRLCKTHINEMLAYLTEATHFKAHFNEISAFLTESTHFKANTNEI